AKPAASIEDGHKSAMLCHLGNIATKLKRTLKVNVAAQTIEDDPEAAALMRRKEYRAPWGMPA
ncbi:MAG: gfo/Idh/MocA family oxidoreductase, partial [Phycisphaerae bacterium]|nr:gfo/Idh/MocA family oxidoreductase [Phycisphaerae bacterium]